MKEYQNAQADAAASLLFGVLESLAIWSRLIVSKKCYFSFAVRA
ncbi:MAG TPA: hypothetical protein P5519_01985 [Spirochaetia bacterium]|nr:hypothetical protein [Spirochaetales bacterium]HRS64644.1 hypothetical protein [Spirochaetia bacterium]HOT59638.1 hypothetical protein [Spirochaetales bacterium]HPD80550.1 hypothetical protein [Spirochaetales bacterium]HQK34408.1 hypothetical protein [Spirochaetales bacterium]